MVEGLKQLLSLSLSRRTNLQNGEVLQDTVHHVPLREVFQSVDEADHVVAHRRPVYPVHKPAVVESRVFRL